MITPPWHTTAMRSPLCAAASPSIVVDHAVAELHRVDPELGQVLVAPGGQPLPDLVVGGPQLLDRDVGAGVTVPLGEPVDDRGSSPRDAGRRAQPVSTARTSGLV